MRVDNIKHFIECQGQRGAALIVSLLILTIMTVIGVTSMQSTSLEEKMTGNLRNNSLAFAAAEAALQQAENLLAPTAELPTFTNTGNGGFYGKDATADSSRWKTVWTTGNVTSYMGITLAKVTTLPMFIVEELTYTTQGGSAGGSLEAGVEQLAGAPRSWYRITARGTGGTDNAEVILQSVYRR
ncbi:pilus assembly PilX family protein [Methylomagnum sp.]